MKDIKMKEHNHRPKVLEKASRMPKELAKKSMLEAKEKSMESTRLSERAEHPDSPVSYASDKTEGAVRRIAGDTGRAGVKASYAAGRKAAQKTYEKLRGQKGGTQAGKGEAGNGTQPEQAEQSAPQAKQPVPKDDPSVKAPAEAGREKIREKARRDAGKKQMERGRDHKKTAGNAYGGQDKPPAIRTRETQEKNVRGKASTVKIVREKPSEKTLPAPSKPRVAVRQTPRMIKSPAQPSRSSYKMSASAFRQTQAAKTAKRAAVKAMQNTAVRMQKTATAVVRFKRAVEAAVKSARNALAALAAGAGAMFVVLILIAGVIGGIFSYSSSQSSASLSEQVLAYTAAIQRYAAEYGIPEYVSVIQAIMMQESGGQGTDPMQCSECPYNTQYPNSPGAIQDPEYSIQVGIRYYADCVREAGCTSPQDMDRLKLSLQGYNYGNGYISWALNNYGGYSEANALLFSQQQAASHGWAAYGDPEYVPHVLRYYSGGNPFGALFGNEQIVSVALSQLGNAGGQKFWSWYGFESYELWCACFVSWCGDQCGLIENGSMPRFSLCDDGIAWFKGKGKWQERGYTPSAGTLIFFDWNGDGTSDHVGIVEKTENGVVYTVEGNSGDAVNQRSYDINNGTIMGYGLIGY